MAITFPLQWVEKENSPDLLAFLQQFGEKYYLRAEEINLIFSAINDVNARLSPLSDEILIQTGIALEGNSVKLNIAWIWRINGITYSNEEEIIIAITFSAPGKIRQDIVLLNQEGSAYVKKGPEGNGVAVKPKPDPNTIEATSFIVTENSIGNPENPSTGNIYVKKAYSSELFFGLNGDISVYLISASYGFYIFNGACTSFASLNLINTLSDGYVGKPLGIKNNQTIPLSIKHLSGTGSTKFVCPNSQDYVIQPGETVFFRFSFLGNSSGNYMFDFSNRQNYTPQRTILGNTTLDNSYNGCLLKIKATSIITIPSSLAESFMCIARTSSGAIATWTAGEGFTIETQNGNIQDPFKMITFYKDGNSNTGVLTGETRS